VKPALVFNMAGGGGGSGVKLASIEILTPPEKLDYISGDAFDPTGMTVEATYSNGAKRMVTDFQCIPEVVEDDMGYITIRYTEEGVSAQVQQVLQVAAKLEEITVTILPGYTEYEYMDVFDPAGIKVRASYSNGDIYYPTTWSWSPKIFSQLGTQTVTVRYEDGGVGVETEFAVSVLRKSIPYPDQLNELVYSGEVQRPEWSSVDEQVTISGVLEATLAGTYETLFTPKEFYRWEDGTTEQKAVRWTIQKAPGVAELSDETVELKTAGETQIVTVSVRENAVISAVCEDVSVAEVSVNGSDVTVTAAGSGSTVIRITVAETDNYLQTEILLSAKVSTYSEIFADNDWSRIAAACQSGQIPDTWNVGDSKTMVILTDDGEEALYQVDIIGKNHDEYKGGGTAPLTLMLHEVLDAKYSMNNDDDNTGGFGAMKMSVETLPNILLRIPEEVRNAIKPVVKTFAAYGGTFVGMSFHLFLPSIVEVAGEAKAEEKGEGHLEEGIQYEYFQTEEHRKKTIGSMAATWWTRSSDLEYNDAFWCINNRGLIISSSVDVARYVSFAFCF